MNSKQESFGEGEEMTSRGTPLDSEECSRKRENRESGNTLQDATQQAKIQWACAPNATALDSGLHTQPSEPQAGVASGEVVEDLAAISNQ